MNKHGLKHSHHQDVLFGGFCDNGVIQVAFSLSLMVFPISNKGTLPTKKRVLGAAIYYFARNWMH